MANSALPWQLCFLFTPASSGHHKTSKRITSDMHPASVRSLTMKVVVGLVLMLVNVRLSRSCRGVEQTLFCPEIPPAFSSGYSSLLMILRDVGEINSTVLRSDSLVSVTKLFIENAGVTGIAEGAFSSFQNLRDLSLTQNLLTEINPKWFGRPDVLSELYLAENHIQVLNESMINGLSNLTTLSLSKNWIRTIDLNSFSSLTILAELDLSGNRMTRVSPQVFRSLRSTRIRLDGNPWDCSCGAEDLIDFVKDLHNRSLLDRPMEVTCESPPSLRGRPALNVSVCVTSPPPRPPSATPTIHPKPTDVLTAGPATTSAKVVSTPPSQPASKTSIQPKPSDIITSSHTATPPSQPASKTSIQPKPSDIITSSHTATPPSQPASKTSIQPKPSDIITPSHTATPPAQPSSETKTSIQPKPSDIITSSHTATPPSETKTSVQLSDVVSTVTTFTNVTPSPSVTQISVHHKPSELSSTTSTTSTPTGTTETCVTSGPSSDANIVWLLVVVIVVLSSLLLVACFLVVLRSRKRNSKTVTPGCPEEKRNELKEDSRSSCVQSPENNHWDSEMGWRRSFTGVRAKSANAILLMSPFCAPVTLQTETQSKEAENQDEGEQKLGDETEVDGGVEMDNLATDAGRNLDENSQRVSVNADAVPYLSIGTNQNKPGPDGFNKGQRSQTGTFLGRISTWPPTAGQWRARCKMQEEESDVFTVWTPEFADEVKKALQKEEHPSGSDQEEDDFEKDQTEEPLKMTEAHMKFQSTPNDKRSCFSEALPFSDTRLEEQLKEDKMIQDPANVRQTQNLNQDLKSAENPAYKNAKKSSNKAEERKEPKRAGTSRQTGSKGPSGGTSPDDEALLSGNEYAFMDLLHEVVQNNGRWTRQRWKQIQVNKQRRQDGGD